MRWMQALMLGLGLVAALPATATSVVLREDLRALFEGREGSFVLYDVAADREVLVNAARADQRFTPASTFKIANSLLALETGAVRDAAEVLPYGGQPQPFAAWERDMTLGEAIAASNVPVFQGVARRIGRERMQAGVKQLGYGNAEIGSVVDRFWLDGPLAISAREQAQFVAKLAQGTLPLSKRSQALVRPLLRVDEGLYAKSGWLFDRKPQLGWWVGWVEREGRVYSFALNLDMAGSEDAPRRRAIAEALLRALDVLPAQTQSRGTR